MRNRIRSASSVSQAMPARVATWPQRDVGLGAASLVPDAPVFTNTERLALAGFLAGYSGLTREAYELDLLSPRRTTRLTRTSPCAGVDDERR
jgi:hypothetical protein